MPASVPQRILRVQYELPPDVVISDSCIDLIQRIFVKASLGPLPPPALVRESPCCCGVAGPLRFAVVELRFIVCSGQTTLSERRRLPPPPPPLPPRTAAPPTPLPGPAAPAPCRALPTRRSQSSASRSARSGSTPGTLSTCRESARWAQPSATSSGSPAASQATQKRAWSAQTEHLLLDKLPQAEAEASDSHAHSWSLPTTLPLAAAAQGGGELLQRDMPSQTEDEILAILEAATAPGTAVGSGLFVRGVKAGVAGRVLRLADASRSTACA